MARMLHISSAQPPSTIPLSAPRAFSILLHFFHLIGGAFLLHRPNWRHWKQPCHCSERSQVGPRPEHRHRAGWCKIQACHQKAPCIVVVSTLCLWDKGRDRRGGWNRWNDGHVVDSDRAVPVQWDHRSRRLRGFFMTCRGLPGWVPGKHSTSSSSAIA